ncbi:MAG: biotin carboxylase N-terminal domain-containing protein [Acidimicrobiales bacterium]
MTTNQQVPTGTVPTRTIRTLLVANRGEIARRIMRTARAMGIATVAVYADGDAGAPFVTEADEAYALHGRSSAETYLDVAKVLDVARRSGADAVHPGYGFLSENAAFAQAVLDAGLAWVGPPPAAIRAMGDKLEAKRLAIAAGVPPCPWPPRSRRRRRHDRLPLLVKASAGGGGKGMRVVNGATELAEAVASAQREAQASFGDPTVFFERYVGRARHIEVQVLGDHHGEVVHLGARVLDPAPSPEGGGGGAVPGARRRGPRARIGAAAMAAARAVGYHSAGTVEFLYDDGEGGSRFLGPTPGSRWSTQARRGDLRHRHGPEAAAQRRQAPVGLQAGRPAGRHCAIEVRLYAGPRPTTSCPPPARCWPGSRPPTRRCATTAASRPARWSASGFDDLAKVIARPTRPGRRR